MRAMLATPAITRTTCWRHSGCEAPGSPPPGGREVERDEGEGVAEEDDLADWLLLRGQLHQGGHEAEDQDAEQHGEDAPERIAPLGGGRGLAHQGCSRQEGNSAPRLAETYQPAPMLSSRT